MRQACGQIQNLGLESGNVQGARLAGHGGFHVSGYKSNLGTARGLYYSMFSSLFSLQECILLIKTYASILFSGITYDWLRSVGEWLFQHFIMFANVFPLASQVGNPRRLRFSKTLLKYLLQHLTGNFQAFGKHAILNDCP